MRMICRRHIFPTKISTRVQPRDWSSVQLFGCPALQVNPCHYVQPCRADDFYVRRSRLNIAVFLDWERFSGSLTQPHPTSEHLQISFTLWERTTCVYLNVLIRQWSSLHPACPLLRDTSKSSWSERCRTIGPRFFRLAMIMNLDALCKASFS